MITIKATDEQIKQMFINAANASKPLGMGFLHYEEKGYTISDIETEDEYHADYFHGRMMKTWFKKESDGVWVVGRGPDIPNPEYQGWASIYPTYEKLAETVGAEIIHKD